MMTMANCGRYSTPSAKLALAFLLLLGHVEHIHTISIPDFIRGHVTAFAGSFPISKDAIQKELVLRASQLTFQNDYKFSFDPEVRQTHNISSSDHIMVIAYVEYDISDSIEDPVVLRQVNESLEVKEEYLWIFVPSIKVGEKGDKLLIFSVACITDSRKNVFLPHFGDYIFRIDSLRFEDGILKLKNGSDEMVIRMSYDPECPSVTDTENESWHSIRLEQFFSLSHPLNWEFCDKFTNFGVHFCEELEQNSCAVSHPRGDICFLFDYIGPKIRCEAAMEIENTTGVFGAIPLLQSIPRKTALEAEWIDGDRSIELTTPCLTK